MLHEAKSAESAVHVGGRVGHPTMGDHLQSGCLCSIAEYLPPPHVVVVATSLESFHSRGSDRPAKGARLTRREASHFVVAMAARSWI